MDFDISERNSKSFVGSSCTRLDNVVIGEDDSVALVDNEANGVTGSGELGVVEATGNGLVDNNRNDDLFKCSPPVLGDGDVLLRRQPINVVVLLQ